MALAGDGAGGFWGFVLGSVDRLQPGRIDEAVGALALAMGIGALISSALEAAWAGRGTGWAASRFVARWTAVAYWLAVVVLVAMEVLRRWRPFV